MIIDDELIEEHFKNCRNAGMPRDQADMFMKAGYIPHKRQQQFHVACRQAQEGGATQILFGGCRGGGKSHGAISGSGIDDCQRFPGLKVLFLRKYQRSARESFNDLVLRTMRGISHEKQSDKLIFPNGSFILFGGYRNSQDLEKYIGIEYDLIIIEELTQLTWDDYQKLRGSLRTSRTDGWRPKMYLTTNPGGVGHDWVKRYFVDGKGGEDTLFIPSGAADNPHINKEYKEYLDNLTGVQRAMWRDGVWDIQDGRAFPAFDDNNILAVDEYKTMVSNGYWVNYRGIDFGTRAPFCCLWGAVNPTMGRVIIYREIYRSGLPAGDQANLIQQYTLPEETISVTFCDPAMFIQQSRDYQLESVADIYNAHGVYLTRGDNNRVSGKMKIDNLLSLKPDGKTGLYVVDSCANLISQLTNLQLADKNKEDVNTVMEDHAYDALRYLCSGVRDVRILNRDPEKLRRNPMEDLAALFPD